MARQHGVGELVLQLGGVVGGEPPSSTASSIFSTIAALRAARKAALS